MSEERMHFGDTASETNAMYVAEHFVRYAALAQFAQGRRVLDIACGEGYGSWLLKEWGASSVLGIDISQEAISVAKQQFSREGVEYLIRDACSAADDLPQGSFDLIASFETIEHVHDPDRFLAGLRALAAPGALIFVSCPNDHAALAPDQTNPYHMRKYTFEEFKICSERVLGPAAQWLLGVNVQGYALVSEKDPLIQPSDRRGSDIVSAAELSSAHLLPSQHNLRPDRTNVLYYVGVWGVTQRVSPAAVSAQSYLSYVELWKALDWFKAERLQLQRELEKASAEPVQLQVQLVEARRQIEALNRVIANLGTDARGQDAKAAAKAAEAAEARATAAAEAEVAAEAAAAAAAAAAAEAEKKLEELHARHAAVLQSKSWRLTRILRLATRLMRGEFSHVKQSLLDYKKRTVSNEKQ